MPVLVRAHLGFPHRVGHDAGATERARALGMTDAGKEYAMDRLSGVRVLLFVSIVGVIGCCVGVQTARASEASGSAARHEPVRGVVVEAGEIGALLGRAGGAAVLDVRDALAYRAGHVPGAVRVDVGRWKQLSLSGEDGLSNAEAWRARIGSLGIDGDDAVVVYDDGSMTAAARVWFILQHFGVREIAVVNGGFPMIEEAIRRGELAGRLSRSTATVEPRAAVFDAGGTGSGAVGSIGTRELRDAIDAGEVRVLDARTPEEFLGEDARGNERAGHLPSAINVPHRELLDEQGRLRPAGELAAILEGAGFERGVPVVVHCQSGGRSSLAALAATRAGFGPVVNYYLSFGAWSADATCTVVDQ